VGKQSLKYVSRDIVIDLEGLHRPNEPRVHMNEGETLKGLKLAF